MQTKYAARARGWAAGCRLQATGMQPFSVPFFGFDADRDAAEVHETRVRMNTAHARRGGSLARCKPMVRGPKGPNYWFVSSRIVRGLISSRRANHSFTHIQTKKRRKQVHFVFSMYFLEEETHILSDHCVSWIIKQTHSFSLPETCSCASPANSAIRLRRARAAGGGQRARARLHDALFHQSDQSG